MPALAFHLAFEQQRIPLVSLFPIPREIVLAGQGVQLMLPSVAANVPLGQAEHMADPGLDAYEPQSILHLFCPSKRNEGRCLRRKACSLFQQWRLAWRLME